VRNIMPRVEWEALRGLCGDVSLIIFPSISSSLLHVKLHDRRKGLGSDSTELLELKLTHSHSSASPASPLPLRNPANFSRKYPAPTLRNSQTVNRHKLSRIYITCCWKQRSTPGSWCAGTVDMSIRSRRGLRISCCQVI
jgi:hypothetical protein